MQSNYIASKVTQFIEKNKLEYSKLNKGIGMDRTAVMIGRRNGCVKQIIDGQIKKQIDLEPDTTPCKALGQHCAAHKLNLAESQAGNAFLVIKELLEHFKEII